MIHIILSCKYHALHELLLLQLLSDLRIFEMSRLKLWHPFFTIDIITFPAALLKISLMPIGLKPDFLFRWIKRHAVKASNVCSLSLLTSICSAHNFLMNFATAFHKLDAQLPNEFETKMRRQPSASRPDVPEPPFVFIAAFITSASSMSSYTTWWTCWIDPCNKTSGVASLLSGCFVCNSCKV